jgi:hypothetical protein
MDITPTDDRQGSNRWNALAVEHVIESSCVGGDRALHQVQQWLTDVPVKHRGNLDRLTVDGGAT